MPDLTQAGRIRDPVHGYVFFTGIERVILDHPIAQRMRHVAQSGMAQMVFPEVRTSRFSHSLGAMHLASQFLALSLENADEGTREQLGGLFTQAVDEQARFGTGLDESEIRDLFRGQGFRVASLVSDERRAAALLIEQALRLAALFHDIGHLPFSHDFEYALEELIRREESEEFRALVEQGAQVAIHERLGYRLAHHLQRQLFGALVSAPSGRAVEVSFAIAEQILDAPAIPAGGAGPASELEGLYQWLHSLIAGELDVDRCDYVLRDTRHYGFEFASYDVKRMVDNLVVVTTDVEHELRLAVLPQGQSAAESFLLARFRMYQWGIRHHKVVQAAAALRKAIRDLLRPALTASPGGELRQFLDDLVAIVSSTNAAWADHHTEVLERFAGYDDAWWMLQMRQVAAADPGNPWLGLACYRRRGPVSLWKRVLDFPVFDLQAWNEQLPAPDDLEARRRWADMEATLESDLAVLVVRHYFRPWEPADRADPTSESALCLWHPGRDELVPLTKVSPLVTELRTAWMGDIQVHAFAATAGVDPTGIVNRIEEVTTHEGDEDG